MISNVVNNIVANTNPPYGFGTTPNSGRCAVIEAWGFMVGRRMADARNGLSHSNTGFGNSAFLRWTNFWLEGQVNWDGYINYGFLYDLMDDNLANPPGSAEVPGIKDEIRGFTYGQIFSSIGPQITSGDQQRAFLRNTVLPLTGNNNTVSNFDALASFYPWF